MRSPGRLPGPRRRPGREALTPASAYAACMAAPAARAPASPRASANAVGPLPEIDAPSAPGRERGVLGLGETRAAGAPARARRSDHPARVPAARSRRRQAPRRSPRPGPPGAGRGERHLEREHGARIPGAQSLVGMHQGDPEVGRNRQAHDVRWIDSPDQHDPAQQRRRHIVRVPTRHGRLGLETSGRAARCSRAATRADDSPPRRPRRRTPRSRLARRRAAGPCGR